MGVSVLRAVRSLSATDAAPIAIIARRAPIDCQRAISLKRAARKIVEIANAVEIVQDGRVYIEKINGPMLFDKKATPAARTCSPESRIAVPSGQP